MNSQKSTRRSVLKAIGGTTAIVSATGVGSAETKQGTTETPTESPFDFEYRTVGDDVRDAVGSLWWLLTVDHDRIDELLSKSSLSTKATRRKQDTVNGLRSTYEVELERDEENERELTYRLTEPAVRSVEEMEFGRNTLEEASSGSEAVESVANSVSTGLRQEAEPRIEPTHSGAIHKKMAARSVKGTKWDTDYNVEKGLKPGSIKPDQWPQKCKVCSDDWLYLGDKWDIIKVSPDKVEEELRKKIRKIDDSASPHHMYVPGGEEFKVTGLLSHILPDWISTIKVEVEGAAPRDAQEHWEDGFKYVPDFDDVGRAFHFLQDMSHPLHTGSIGPQVLYTQGTVHEAYMCFVEDNWDSAEETYWPLRDDFDNGLDLPQWDGSMEKACEEIANQSSNYSEQVYETIINNGPDSPDDWDGIVNDAAGDGAWYVGAYSRGAINQL